MGDWSIPYRDGEDDRDPKYVSGNWKRQRFKDLGPEGPSMKLKLQEGPYKDHRQRKTKWRAFFLSTGGVSERWLKAVCFSELRWYSSGMWCCSVENGMTTFLWTVDCHIPEDGKFYHLDCYIYVTANSKCLNFTFLLTPRCIVIDFFVNNQPDALIIPILFCYKTLHVSGIFCAHHQEFYTVHSALVSFDASFFMVIRNLHETYQCRMYSRKLLMMGREDARNMWSFITEWNWDN